MATAKCKQFSETRVAENGAHRFAEIRDGKIGRFTQGFFITAFEEDRATTCGARTIDVAPYDVCELYVELLTMPAEKIAGEIFNAGYQNQTVNELAEIPKQIVEEDHADVLVASLTSDSHINKANFRPFVPQDLRAMNLAAHECVDYVIIDDNETPIENLKVIQPDFFRERLRVFC
jgi:hypothetical protein